MILKYIFDRLVSFIGLLILSPLLLIITILIAIKMPNGPIIFSQKRVGKNGELFTMYKFRTMTIDHNGSPISVAGENRITPLGAKLRKYKIDELPELWNVFTGDMSFVGPRPDVPGYADLLKGNDRLILNLRPGITGPASLKYRNEEELLSNVENPKEYNDNIIFPDKVRLNLYYYSHYSFFADIRIIMCTVFGRNMRYNNEII